MTQNPNLAALSAAGVSVWLDDLSRDRLQTGNLQELIDTSSVVGVTTNPSIFQAALSKGNAYDDQVKELAERGADVDATIRTVTTDDVRNACDVLAKQYEPSDGVDGRVSIEVDPRLAHDTDKTILQAIELWKIVDRPNLLIKIPATRGRPARDHRRDRRGHLGQRDADLLGRAPPRRDGRLPRRAGEGQGGRPRPVQDPLRRIVLRVPRGHRDRQAAGEDRQRRGAGAARARQASPTPGSPMPPTRRCSSAARASSALKADGARVQRPLWASTGVKNPDYSDTLYVTELVAPNTVNTMPEKTMDAVADHGVITGDTVTGTADAAQAVFDKLAAVGIDLTDVFMVLESEGVDKFEKSWQELLEATQGQLDEKKS